MDGLKNNLSNSSNEVGVEETLLGESIDEELI